MRTATTRRLVAKLTAVLAITGCSTSLLWAEDIKSLLRDLYSEPRTETAASDRLAELPAKELLPVLTEALKDDAGKVRRSPTGWQRVG